MGSQPSNEEREADMREWQHKEELFRIVSHKLGQLQDFVDSKSPNDVDERMGNNTCVDEESRMQSQPSESISKIRADRDMSGLHNLVSMRKKRLQRHPFDLDMAYITKRIIAMGFPATGFQSTYRNSRDDVISFLATYHPTHHKVYNLCSEQGRYYSTKDFPNIRVSVYPIRDHYPSNTYMTFVFCLDAYFYMREHRENVIAVHCKAGKGRTGMMVVSFLLFSGLCRNAEEAILYYGKRRAYDWVGISIPSQIRCVKNFERYLREEFGMNFSQRIEHMVHKYDIISQRLKSRMERPYRLLCLRLTPIIRRFSHPAKISIRFQDADKDFTAFFTPKITESSIEFTPRSDIVVNGDFCIVFKKTYLKFAIWVNPTFFDEITAGLEREMGLEGKSCVAEEFLFARERTELEHGGRIEMPKKSKSDFDKFKTKIPMEECAGMRLTVVCSTVLRNN